MRAKEFITERNQKYNVPAAVDPDVEETLPGTFIFPELTNGDPYYQYRMGLALAVAQATKSREVAFQPATAWAENLVTTAYAAEEEDTIAIAARLMNAKSERIARTKSREPAHINKVSPVAAQKRNKYGV